MGLGDSITEGSDDFASYLFPLWEKMMSAGYEFDFIGPRESKCRIGTLKCGGYSGHTVEFLDSKTTFPPTSPPDLPQEMDSLAIMSFRTSSSTLNISLFFAIVLIPEI